MKIKFDALQLIDGLKECVYYSVETVTGCVELKSKVVNWHQSNDCIEGGSVLGLLGTLTVQNLQPTQLSWLKVQEAKPTRDGNTYFLTNNLQNPEIIKSTPSQGATQGM